jgi:large subunit ribosomal protein L24
VLTVDKRAGTLSVTMRGANGADPQVDARLTAGGLVTTAKGTARLFGADGMAAGLDITFAAADTSPLRRGAAARAKALLPVAVRARLDAAGQQLTLDRITGVIDSTPVRGKLTVDFADVTRIEGRFDTDSADAAALLALVAGMPKAAAGGEASAWPTDPFGESYLGEVQGNLSLSAGRATIAPRLVARDIRATLRFGAGEVAIENVEGTLAGGRAGGSLTLRRTADGLDARGRLAVTGADAATVLPSEGRPAITGRLGLQADFAGNGLSPASLIGSLTGAGAITLEDAQISGLDPKAFNAAIRAVDQGLAIDAPKIRDIVGTVLDGGSLAVPRLDAAVVMNAGQLRIAQTTAYGQGADLTFAGGGDLAEGAIDARLTLLGPSITEGTNTTRPEILVMLKGPLGGPKRTIDVSTLSGFLMLRSVERQARRIDVIEAERRDAERRETEQRREAERREQERRETEARAVTAPAALPAPAPIMQDEGTPPQTPRPLRPRPVPPQAQPSAPALNRVPALPPPLNIGPTPGAGRSGQAPGANGAAARVVPPAERSPRSTLDTLFGVQR